MAEMEDKLGAILSNPQMMQQIMSMAQSFGQSQEQPRQEPQESPPSGPDPAALQKVLGAAGQMGIDSNQQNLLRALKPYLTNQKIEKLEKAMRAAKLANLASTALNSGALSSILGR